MADHDLRVDHVTIVDGVLTSFEIKNNGRFLAKFEKDGTHWSYKTYLYPKSVKKCVDPVSYEVTFEDYQVKQLSEILPVINEFIELQEAKDEQNL